MGSLFVVDFLVEFSSLVNKIVLHVCILSFDDASNFKSSGSEIFLEGLRNTLIEKTFIFEFGANNNQVEHKSTNVEMSLVIEMNALNLIS